MATRNNPLAGRYFNDPNLAVAMSSLASAFAPPGADEYLAAEQIRGTRTQNDAMEAFAAQAGNDPDMLAYLADLYDPVNGIGARNMADATERAKFAAANQTTLRANAADNDAKLRLGVLGAKANPDGSQFVSDEDLLATIGIPGMRGIARNEPVAPLTDAQVNAQTLQRMTEKERQAVAFGNTPLEQIIMDGSDTPTYATRPEAIGQTPFVNKGAEAAAKPIILVDPASGAQVAGVFRDGQYFLQDGTAAPANLVPQNLPSATGSADQLGGTTSNQTQYNKIKAAATEVDMLITEIETDINRQGGATGIAGSAQNFVQNLRQTILETQAAAKQAGLADIPVTPEFLAALDANTGADYNPVFQRIQTNLFRLASATAGLSNPQGEIGQIALMRELENLGQGLLGNDESRLTSLAATRQFARIKLSAAEQLLGREAGNITPLGSLAAPPPATGAGAASTLQPGAVEDGFRYIGGDPANPNSWEPVR